MIIPDWRHNMSETTHEVLNKVRKALGRTEPLSQLPVPPPIDEHIARLVFSDIGLPEPLSECRSAP